MCGWVIDFNVNICKCVQKDMLHGKFQKLNEIKCNIVVKNNVVAESNTKEDIFEATNVAE